MLGSLKMLFIYLYTLQYNDVRILLFLTFLVLWEVFYSFLQVLKQYSVDSIRHHPKISDELPHADLMPQGLSC